MTPTPCPEVVSLWWHIHPGVGCFIVIFGLVGVLVPLIKDPISRREKAILETPSLFFSLFWSCEQFTMME